MPHSGTGSGTCGSWQEEWCLQREWPRHQCVTGWRRSGRRWRPAGGRSLPQDQYCWPYSRSCSSDPLLGNGEWIKLTPSPLPHTQTNQWYFLPRIWPQQWSHYHPKLCTPPHPHRSQELRRHGWNLWCHCWSSDHIQTPAAPPGRWTHSRLPRWTGSCRG